MPRVLDMVHVSLASTEVSNKNTWMLFLPLFPVKTKTPVVLGIGVFVLLLDVVSLLLLGHLLIFHLYLSMCPSPLSSHVSQGRRLLSWPLPEMSTKDKSQDGKRHPSRDSRARSVLRPAETMRGVFRAS